MGSELNDMFSNKLASLDASKAPPALPGETLAQYAMRTAPQTGFDISQLAALLSTASAQGTSSDPAVQMATFLNAPKPTPADLAGWAGSGQAQPGATNPVTNPPPDKVMTKPGDSGAVGIKPTLNDILAMKGPGTTSISGPGVAMPRSPLAPGAPAPVTAVGPAANEGKYLGPITPAGEYVPGRPAAGPPGGPLPTIDRATPKGMPLPPPAMTRQPLQGLPPVNPGVAPIASVGHAGAANYRGPGSGEISPEDKFRMQQLAGALAMGPQAGR